MHTRRGARAFVAQTPTDYPIGKRVRFHQMCAAGQDPAKTVLSIETRNASPAEQDALGVKPEDTVHVHDGLSLADDQPIALFRSVFPATRFLNLPEALPRTGSVTTALAESGVADYTRASTRLTAKGATTTQALHLRIAEGAPVLHSIGVNVDAAGVPVEYG